MAPAPQSIVSSTADLYLSREGGLSFDFDAGAYAYRISIDGSGNGPLHGGGDRDYLWGGGGNDQIAGGAEADNLYGGAGNDLLIGGAGGDRLDGGPGNDRLFGGREVDRLLGGDGDDYLDAGAGHESLDGGPGNDTLIGGPGSDAFFIDPESGNDVVRDFTAGPGMFDHLALRDLRWEDLTFVDTPAGVRVTWDGGSILLEGVAKADLAQDDFMFRDQPDLPPGLRAPDGPSPERPSPSMAGPEIGPSTLGPAQQSFDLVADAALGFGAPIVFDFDTYRVGVGSQGPDVFDGSELADHFIGRGGDDRIDGAAGNDILQGDAGGDTLQGGDGVDHLDGGAGDDRLFGGGDSDTVLGKDGNDYLDAGPSHDGLDGGPGDDTLVGGSGADAFIVTPESGHDVVLDMEVRGQAQGAFDHIALRDIRPEDVTVADTPDGAIVSWDVDHDGSAEGSILLDGVAKADLRQSDFMFIGAPGFVPGISDFGSYYIFPASRATGGNDTIRGGADDDFLQGLGGNDRLVGLGGDDRLQGGNGNDTLLGGSGADSLDGGKGHDRIDGGNGADLLLGISGDDTLTGGSGDDTAVGGEGNDRVDGDAGDDRLAGNDGNDRLEGGAGSDALAGGRDSDTLLGGDGDDTVGGGLGNDRLEGNAGNDLLLGDSDGEQSFTAVLDPLSGSGVSGAAELTLYGDLLTVRIAATGLEPGQPHPQHIHGRLVDGHPAESGTPTLAQDADGDGFIELAEGLPTYGPILVPLTSPPGGALTGFPTAPGGTVAFTETYDLSDPSVFAGGFGTGELLPLPLREIVLHGRTVGSVGVPPGEVDGTAGFKAVLPVAAGEIERAPDAPGGGDDTLIGGAGDDMILAGAGNDRLDGGDGNDTLEGGTGDDLLIGSGGADRFVFDGAAIGTGQDVVRDFDEGVDKLLLLNVAEGDLDKIAITQFSDLAVLDLSSLFHHDTGTDTLKLNGVTSFDQSDVILL